MNQLTINHLAPYLCYRLKFQHDSLGVMEMEGIMRDISDVDAVYIKGSPDNYMWLPLYQRGADAKPILRNLSDLTKPITHRGEKFVPVRKIEIYRTEEDLIDNLMSGMIEQIVYENLCSWMFDVRNLIGQNLAIDVNSLPDNPYEKL